MTARAPTVILLLVEIGTMSEKLKYEVFLKSLYANASRRFQLSVSAKFGLLVAPDVFRGTSAKVPLLSIALIKTVRVGPLGRQWHVTKDEISLLFQSHPPVRRRC